MMHYLFALLALLGLLPTYAAPQHEKEVITLELDGLHALQLFILSSPYVEEYSAKKLLKDPPSSLIYEGLGALKIYRQDRTLTLVTEKQREVINIDHIPSRKLEIILSADKKHFETTIWPWDISDREMEQRRSEMLAPHLLFSDLYQVDYVEKLPINPRFIPMSAEACKQLGIPIYSYCKPRKDIFIVTNASHAWPHRYGVAVFAKHDKQWKKITPHGIVIPRLGHPDHCELAESILLKNRHGDVMWTFPMKS